MVFRQKLQMGLGSLQETFAEHQAAADGDLRLDDMITAAMGIDFGIEQGQDALLLVGFQQNKTRRSAAWPERKGPCRPGSSI